MSARASANGRRLRIEGDHSDYHGGCAAVFQALSRIASKKGWQLVGPDSEYDALLMNGEGTMHHGSEGFHRKMQSLRAALDAGRRAYLVNTVWQENPAAYDDVLRRLSGITVREVLSQNDLRERHGINARVIPDISTAQPVSWFQRRQHFRRAPAVTDFWFPDSKTFDTAAGAFPHAKPFDFMTCSWGFAVQSIKTASHLITGRQHAVFAACAARTPFVASEGNTHKITGIVRTAGVDIPIASHPHELPEIASAVLRRRDEFSRLFKWLAKQDYRQVVPSPGEQWA